MSHSTLALALAIASVPVCFVAARRPLPPVPLSPAQGPALADCVPAIRPQTLAIEPLSATATQAQATLLVTTLTDSTKSIFVRGSGSDAVEELSEYARYTITVQYPTGGAAPTASMTNADGVTVVTGFDSIASHLTTSGWLTLANSNEYANAALLQFNHNDWLTTVFLTIE